MCGGGVECSSVYTAACPRAAKRVCSANPILNFVCKMTPKEGLKVRPQETNIRKKRSENMF
jgi:hypothetical protein